MQQLDFKEAIRTLSDRVATLKDSISTEEATKTAMILPFIQSLGYDIFNPSEVVPEFTADVGSKKGEKVDYAIFKDKKPILIIECKHYTDSLSIEKSAQLARYFGVTETKFALLTNGITYRFYSDLESTNVMDTKPFFEVDITQITDNQIEELRRFSKQQFDLTQILDAAAELRYAKAIRELFVSEVQEPSEDFAKYFASKVYTGKVTQAKLDYFGKIVKKTLNLTVSEMVATRLKNALARESELSSAELQSKEIEQVQEPKQDIETTVEEMEAFYMVKSIVRSRIDINRVFYRDAKGHFSILADDSVRKPIAKFYLNSSKKKIGIFDANKNEVQYEIQTLDDVFKYASALEESAAGYAKG
ncbi:MAG: type I restriction enzyme HsdR N-terminal domain-containing protein [Bacteroidia bacterium]|nr:type I restriction enzyme HsdR N-terminal domain-containing protein [Bacteroidia bacterium]